ncbi:sigma-70 family RNA polymerase sigma factor [Thauera sinica]|uniref:Sigma-70 family RNA polymerase sigma factor n=1 Tax=Thauera sinica TaxID=2665146 RepID=A0ABW1AQH0_9RHOO|nr:sigma-70 family RNA polymerase sigma factor [Thauera sp. K11]ATE59661.1 RNA polymerase subunit sigma [Thauera sp. K11]
MSAEAAVQQQVHAWYSDHHGWLKAWLCRTLGCPHRAADVAHNTFLRVIAGRHSLADVQQPRAWLTTTAKRLIVDEVRRERIEQAYLAELAALGEDDWSPSPEQILAAVQALMQLCSVLESVSAKARTAFVRHYIDGETQAAVADELGVSTKMIQKYLVRVLVEVRCIGLGA